MTSQVARRYQLENGHYLNGEIAHGKQQTAKFKYAIKSDKTTRSQPLHGFVAADTAKEIETVNIEFVNQSDIVTLADGLKYSVVGFDEKPIDENQLRNLPWEKVDKVWRISLRRLA